ncbi:MAG: PEP-CTERM sorting domain-containing protein [Bryobacterales bacterium]|nr:PEP-CTERM sorting domain-containing protein [Bryobacterales bacterium]
MMVTSVRSLLCALALLTVGGQASNAATVYDIQSGGLQAQYFYSTTLGGFFDLRGTSPAGLTIGVTVDGTPLGSVLIAETPGAPFGNTTLNALSGPDFIQLTMVPGSEVFSVADLSLTLLGTAGGPITTLPLFPLLANNVFTFGLTDYTVVDAETVLATYELTSITTPSEVPEPSTAAMLLGGLGLVVAARKLRASRS